MVDFYESTTTVPRFDWKKDRGLCVTLDAPSLYNETDSELVLNQE